MISLWNCEKDDICSETTPTTPQLVIDFYDMTNTSDLKNVTNLKITGSGQTVAFYTFTGVSTIKIPLNPGSSSVAYEFNINSSATNITNNIDIIKFNYETRNVYISRACGYKTLFDLNPTNPFIRTNPASDIFNWIETLQVQNFNIENEDETHIKIFF